MKKLDIFSLLFLIVGALLIAAPTAIAQTTEAPPEIVWPAEEWTRATPEEQGMSSLKLQEMVDYIEENYISINAIVIVRNGYLVLEQYFDFFDENRTSNIFSCTKSFTSTMMGLALDNGYIDNVSQRVLDFFPDRTIENLNDWKEAMTIEDLLTMQAGFNWNDNSDAGMSEYNDMLRSDDWVQYVLDRPMALAPGTVWNYNSGASHLISAIVQNATGMMNEDFAEQYLMEPIGIESFTWRETDQDINIGGNTIQLTALNMARFGYLFLREGDWNGQQILSSEWVNEATSEQAIVSPTTSYGYQWWLSPTLGSYSARGYAGQYIYVVPEKDLVVVFKASSGWNNVAMEEWIFPSIEDETSMPIDLVPIIFTVGVIGVVVVVVIFKKLR